MITILPTPDPNCKKCHGTGQIIEHKTYGTQLGISIGGTSISPCDCGTYFSLPTAASSSLPPPPSRHSGCSCPVCVPDKPLFSDQGLLPEKDCEKCKGTGWLSSWSGRQDPGFIASAFTHMMCNCVYQKDCPKCEGTGFDLKKESFCDCWETKTIPIKCNVCKDTGKTEGGQKCSCWLFQTLEEKAQKAIDENYEDVKYGIKEIPQKSKPIDSLDKYWGNITTLVKEEGFFIKTMFMKSGTNSSLEYHLEKKEYYYIAEGILEVGLRIGRGVNKKITLNKGDIFYIKPGLMHCRKAITDVLIIEWGNKDNDSDTYIVEDGKTYKHIVNEQKLP